MRSPRCRRSTAPRRRCRWSGAGETMTHDYKRHGTTTLFAALNVLTGTIISQCLPRHRHQELLKFLTYHRPRRSQGSADPPDPGQLRHPQAPSVRQWLDKHPRFHLHFTPTSSSWLNLVERWFRELTDKALRRGVFHSVPDLVASIAGIHRRPQQRPQALRVDRHRRIYPRQSRTRSHRPRKSQLNTGHTTR